MEKQKSHKPKIRFPEFKDDWEHVKLNELLCEAKKRNGNLKYGKDEVLSVSGELGIVNQIEHLGRSYAGVSVHQYHVVEVGDIVYTKSPLKANPFGIIKVNKGKAGIVSTLYAVYKVNNKTAYGPWIDYYFSLDANTNRYLRPLVKKGAKNDMKISNAYVLHDRIYAPAIIEQQKIASFLTAVDEKLQVLKKKKYLLEQYKKGVIQKIFSQELRFKADDGSEFPEWEVKKLGELCEIMYGKDHRLVNNETGIYPILGTGGEMGRTNEFIYNKPSVLIGRKGTIDKPRYMDTPFWTVDTLFYTKINNTVYPKWLYYSFCTINWYLYNEASGVPSLSTSTIKKIDIYVPSLPEQIKIANFLSVIDNKVNHVLGQIEKMELWKKGLLQKMFV